MFFFLSLFLACRNSPQPTRPEDCMAMSKGALRDDCWSDHIHSVFKQDEAQGMKVIREQISDPLIADYLWLTITREYNPSTRKYCEQINNASLKERCMVLVSRPHLHRDILRAKSDGETK